MEYILIFISAIFVNNIVLSQFLGICPFLGVSQKINTSLGMSAAVAFVMTLATIVTYLVQYYILNPLGIQYLQTIAFILVIAALVQMVEIILKKSFSGSLSSLGNLLAADYYQLCCTWSGHSRHSERLFLGTEYRVCIFNGIGIWIGIGCLCRNPRTIGNDGNSERNERHGYRIGNGRIAQSCLLRLFWGRWRVENLVRFGMKCTMVQGNFVFFNDSQQILIEIHKKQII